jgi:AbrB family looped-hinge helix DNA binding protein
MSATATITSKGQVTLPREVRDFLKTRTVEFEVVDDVVVMRPVESVGGSLAQYAKEHHSIHAVREKVWTEVAREKVREKE